MNPADADRWKSELLDEIFAALAASEEINRCLVFKGARVLQMRLGGGRQSLDLDSNLSQAWVRRFPDREAQRVFLEQELTLAIRRHFERQDPVRYQLMALRVRTYPARAHPLGWDGHTARLSVNDLSKQVHGLPALEIDVAAPEELMDSSVSTIAVGAHHVRAYTLERIAGEKLRAFLSSLPAYRAKVKKPGEAVRAKDLYDLARVLRTHDIAQIGFWKRVAQEFTIACRSRYIDCEGLATFQQQWQVTRKTYEEATIPKDVPFAEAESALVAIVRLLEELRFIPFTWPLPPTVPVAPE